MDPYWGSADIGDGDRNSDKNRMASVNIKQYNTVTNQC